jgi:hypothetical protein
MSIKPVAGSQPQHIFMPTPAELAVAYRTAVDNAFKNNTAVALKEAPKGAKKSEAININPPGEEGVNRQVFDIGVKLFVRQIDVAPNAKAHWYNVGFAPDF